MTEHQTERDEHPCQRAGIELDDGDRVYINQRSRPLTVTGRHNRQQATGKWRRLEQDKYHTVIELEGNGTEYHLLCTGGSSYGPMLYKESDWDDDKTNKIGLRPKYSRGGERVENLRLVEK
jgi:hypothetical protein